MDSDFAPWSYTSPSAARKKLQTLADGDEQAFRLFKEHLTLVAVGAWAGTDAQKAEKFGRAYLATIQKRWRERHPEKAKELQAQSYRNHYEKNYPRYVTNSRNYRARKALADGSHTSEETSQMLRDQGGRCAYCETALEASYHVDHMTPLSRGGSNDWSNLAITCASCNREKGTMTAVEYFSTRQTPPSQETTAAEA
jgi:5-methylcytosine-specific restriction endonuclease McrA